MRIPRLSARIAVPTIAALAVSGAVAYATIPDEGGVIHGCYNTTSVLTRGQLRVIDSAATCRPGEISLNWNQAGKSDPATGGAGAGGADVLTLGGRALSEGLADAYLQLDGIQGQAAARGFEGQIPIKSFGYNIVNQVVAGPGGGGAGKVQASAVHVTKLTDTATTGLLKSVTTGSHIADGTISFTKPNGGPDDVYLRVKLTDIVVSGFSQGGKSEPVSLENIDLTPQRFEYRFRPQNPDGTLGGEQVFGYDFSRSSVS